MSDAVQSFQSIAISLEDRFQQAQLNDYGPNGPPEPFPDAALTIRQLNRRCSGRKGNR